MQCRDTAKKGLPVKDDGLNPFTLAISQNANEMTQKGFFFLTHNNKENGRGDNCSDILEAEKKPKPIAAMRKAKNKTFAHKHPQDGSSMNSQN